MGNDGLLWESTSFQCSGESLFASSLIWKGSWGLDADPCSIFPSAVSKTCILWRTFWSIFRILSNLDPMLSSLAESCSLGLWLLLPDMLLSSTPPPPELAPLIPNVSTELLIRLSVHF